MIRKYGDTTPYEPGEEPLKPGMVRIYEFLHGYNDITEEEYEASINDPLYKIFVEEIQKEIDKEIIAHICKAAK